MIEHTHPKAQILVVDDNPDLADSLAFSLEILQFRVNVAYGGLEAIAAALQDAPDVILLDIGMPTVDGFEVAKRIRQALGATVLLIAHTAWADEATKCRCRKAGFDHHLVKPANLSDILALVDPTGPESLAPLGR